MVHFPRYRPTLVSGVVALVAWFVAFVAFVLDIVSAFAGLGTEIPTAIPTAKSVEAEVAPNRSRRKLLESFTPEIFVVTLIAPYRRVIVPQ